MPKKKGKMSQDIISKTYSGVRERTYVSGASGWSQLIQAAGPGLLWVAGVTPRRGVLIFLRCQRWWPLRIEERFPLEERALGGDLSCEGYDIPVVEGNPSCLLLKLSRSRCHVMSLTRLRQWIRRSQQEVGA